MRTIKTAFLAGLVALAATQTTQGAEWKQELVPYLWASSMDGTIGIGDVTADASMSFSDILDDLEFGFMGTYRASRDRYSVLVDVIYMGLGEVQKGPAGVLKSDIDVDQVGLEADFGYALGEYLTALAGLRYVDLETQIRTTGPLGAEVRVSEKYDWVDPVVGLQWTWPFSQVWSTTVRGDIGGFGVGSEFAWQAIAVLRWQFSPRVGLGLAYRYLDMDYKEGHGKDRFEYDMAMSGPALGVVFTF